MSIRLRAAAATIALLAVAAMPATGSAHPSTIHSIAGWATNSAGDTVDFGSGYTMIAHGTLLLPPAPTIDINGSTHLVRCSRNDFTGPTGTEHIVGIAAIDLNTSAVQFVFIYDNGPFDEFIVTPAPGTGPCSSPIDAWMNNSLFPVAAGPGFTVT